MEGSKIKENIETNYFMDISYNNNTYDLQTFQRYSNYNQECGNSNSIQISHKNVYDSLQTEFSFEHY